MIRLALPVAALVLAGCSSNDAKTASQVADASVETQPVKVVATLTCRSSGQPVPVALCFVSGQNEGSSGNLKIESGGNVKQYSSTELYHASDPSDLSAIRITEIDQPDGPTWQLPLTPPFEVQAQVTGQTGLVLRMVVQQGDKTVFKDEATEFGTIGVSSASLGL